MSVALYIEFKVTVNVHSRRDDRSQGTQCHAYGTKWAWTPPPPAPPPTARAPLWAGCDARGSAAGPNCPDWRSFGPI